MQRLIDAAERASGERRWADVDALFRQLMAIEELTYGPDHPAVAGSLGAIAETLEERGRYTEAELLYRKSLEITRLVLGENDPDTAASYNTVGNNLEAQGHYADAEALYRNALKIFQQVLGDDNIDIAYSYNLLATNLDAQGRYAEAEPLLRKALKIRRRLLGEDDLDTAASYNFVASNLNAQGRGAEAEQLYRKALETRRRVLGEDHPSTATSYNNVGYNLRTQGRAAEAEPLLRKALEIDRRVQGEDHPSTATSFNNVAASLHAQGRYAEAEPLYRKALEIRRRVLGEDHPDTVASYNNVGFNLNAQDRYAEAEPLLRKALAIRRRVLGEVHPDTATSYNNVGANLDAQGRSAEAEPLHRKALETRRRVLGEDHPGTADSYDHVAYNLYTQGRSAEAEPLSWSAVQSIRRIRVREAESRGAGAEGILARASRKQQTDGKGYVFQIYLQTAFSASVAVPARDLELRERAFGVAQDATASSASQALAESSARAAVGAGLLGDAVRRLQDAQGRARALDGQLLTALGRKDGSADAARIRAEQEALGKELIALDAQIRREFPGYADLVSPRALSITETQGRLQAGEGLVLILPAREDVFAFGVGKTGEASWTRLKGGAASVEARVRTLRCQLDGAACGTGGSQPARGISSGYVKTSADSQRPYDRSAAYSLYQDLIAPVEGVLGGVSRVYVVASGPLSALPLQVLLTAAPSAQPLASAPWLGDRYALVSLPAVSNLKNLRRDKPAAASPAKGGAFLGYGDPSLDTPAVAEAVSRSGDRPELVRVFRGVSEGGKILADPAVVRGGLGLVPLPGTKVELEAMAGVLQAPAGAVHLGAAATEAAVKADAGLASARVVAFATHGLLPSEGQREEPGLVFTPPATASENDDGILTASEAAQLHLSADLLILSACNTASADGTPGADSLSSLSRAFLYAGAQGLLASHWHVGDTSTAALTVEILRTRKDHPELTPAQALQTAERTLRTGIRSDGSALPGYEPAWSHPAAWAPFAIIENQDR